MKTILSATAKAALVVLILAGLAFAGACLYGYLVVRAPWVRVPALLLIGALLALIVALSTRTRARSFLGALGAAVALIWGTSVTPVTYWLVAGSMAGAFSLIAGVKVWRPSWFTPPALCQVLKWAWQGSIGLFAVATLGRLFGDWPGWPSLSAWSVAGFVLFLAAALVCGGIGAYREDA